jgi:hypothetical protein
VISQVKSSLHFKGGIHEVSDALAATFASSREITAGGTLLVISWYPGIVV